ncbi:MAG: LytTR family DNA-binding domain-containing protein [Lachnospiraceae bacterium]|nr:LytTR family DNA-binding domain-containing protein [Lachnospiraceae bacterium]MDE7359427.1 LytTR family DNA-binding domain-containing protein [Lachnospiraceae bacterium]
MKITICDDSIKDLLHTEKLLLKYKSLHPDKDFELEKFSDPSRLYQRISAGKLTDIYILDMLMPRRTGIDIGNLIRTSGCESVIIYITSSEDYALDAYGVHAVRYLLKPIDENRLFEALDYSFSYAKLRVDSLCLIKTKEGLLQRPYSKIEYVENAGRKLEVHLTDGEILKSLFIRKSFEEETREIMAQRNFLQIHKSFLVNLDYVKQLTSDSVILASGKRLPVSRAKAANVKREYLLYVSGNIGGGMT